MPSLNGSLNGKIAQNLFIQSLCDSPNVGFFYLTIYKLMETIIFIISAIIVGAGLGFGVAKYLEKNNASSILKNAKNEAKGILKDARAERSEERRVGKECRYRRY